MALAYALCILQEYWKKGETMIVPIELRDIFIIWRAETKKNIQRKCIARAEPDSIFSEDFCKPARETKMFRGKTMDTNNRNVFDAARIRSPQHT